MRNVLYQVYGLASKTYHNEAHGPDQGWESAPIVKTHLLPHQLPEELRQRKIVYLIRDGRDAVVSLAHHRSDVMAEGSDFRQNLLEAIYAADGSHFGGWSNHVKTWVPKADLVIRFEDLITQPIAQIERLRAVMDLPAPNVNALPTFDQLKAGEAVYGSGKAIGKDLSTHWFRKGKVNGWQSEMDAETFRLFWHLHGEAMQVFGYRFDGSHGFDLPIISKDFRVKCGLEKPSEKPPKSVLIEANKVADAHVDGIKRYVLELLKTMRDFPVQDFQVKASVKHRVMSLEDALVMDGTGHEAIEKGLLFWAKSALKVLLPKSAYNAVAKQFPLAKVQRIFKGKLSSKLDENSIEYDLALLTLPQNFEYLSEAHYKRLACVIHDMTHEQVPEFHEENNRHRTELGMRFCVDEKAEFIAVSESTKSDLLQSGISSVLTYEGVDRTVFYPIHNQHLLNLVRERYQLPKQKFLLSVSTLEPRKNLARLIAAYCRLPRQIRDEYHLVLAGKKGWHWKDFEIPKDAQPHIHFTGFVREDHLPALYTLAYGFCYVSLYEGFGLPVLEAMACGCPVLVSNTSSLPEIVGDAGLLCDPKSIEDIEEKLMQLIETAGHKASRISAQEQSWDFTWSRHWERLLEVFQVV